MQDEVTDPALPPDAGDSDNDEQGVPEPTLENAAPAGAPLAPGLYVVGTPIGNLGDLSDRMRSVLGGVSAVLCEDTRHTRILLDRSGVRTPMLSCHKFNEASRIGEAVARLKSGAALALVSDAGMPAISDPGARLVAACHAAGIPVRVVPGPSSVTCAIALSGFGGSGFRFDGFLPPKPGARARRLDAALACDLPVVLFESPFRLIKLLEAVAERAPERLIMVGRELTKKFEEARVGTAGALLEHYRPRTIKGEIVVVLAPAP
ncbi:MAG: 16S rRNA (cytidine(1402)-2'-O)-methyltransferase [bacterium]